MISVERVERQYLADRTALVGAAFQAGQEVTPPTLDEALASLDEALAAKPEPVSDRERDNQAFLRAI